VLDDSQNVSGAREVQHCVVANDSGTVFQVKRSQRSRAFRLLSRWAMQTDCGKKSNGDETVEFSDLRPLHIRAAMVTL
jgi:hypothetical protein